MRLIHKAATAATVDRFHQGRFSQRCNWCASAHFQTLHISRLCAIPPPPTLGVNVRNFNLLLVFNAICSHICDPHIFVFPLTTSKSRRKVEKSYVTFLLCDPGWCVHKSDAQNKWDDNTHTKTRGFPFIFAGSSVLYMYIVSRIV